MPRRKGMTFLKFLVLHTNDNVIVIFDDLKRFARDTIFHFKLKQTLQLYNAKPECLNFKFEDTPEGEFVETVFAAQGQLERLQNRRQTVQKMRARLEQGYWVFAAPMGYKYEKQAAHGKLLVRDEPVASIIQVSQLPKSNASLRPFRPSRAICMVTCVISASLKSPHVLFMQAV